jgi:hypothetical protein
VAYDDQKVKVGKQAVTILELDLDACSLTYGNSPCTASGSAPLKCFNTFGTCQDTANFDKTTKTFRFSDHIIDGAQQVGEAPTFPTIRGVSHSPTVLTPSKGLGIRAKCTVSLTDHPWTDVGCDPYLSDRNYDPNERSTFWGKLLARQKYYEGRVMRVKQGYLSDDGSYSAANFSTRQYIIDKISGPTPDGKVTITGKDPLKFADNNRKQFPEPSGAELVSDITAGAASFDITDADDDVKDAYDAGQPWIRIDDEVMEVINLTGSNPTYTLTVARGTAPSFYDSPLPADSHSEEATVQNCYLYEEEPADDIFYHLLVTVTGIDSSFIDVADWQAKMDDGYQSYLLNTLLTEPTGVQDLLKELTELTFLLWWDEREQKIKLDTLLPRAPDYGGFTDENTFISGSVSITRDVSSRLSRLIFYYGVRSPTLELDEGKNFERIEMDIEANLEGPNAYGKTKIRKIFSRWLSKGKRSVVSEITTRLLNEYKNTKDVITYTIDPKDDDAWTGNTVQLKTRQAVNEFGEETEKDYRILQAKEKHSAKGVVYTYVAHSMNDVGRLGVITPDLYEGSAFPNYTPSTDELKSRYAYIAPDSGEFADGTLAYVIR